MEEERLYDLYALDEDIKICECLTIRTKEQLLSEVEIQALEHLIEAYRKVKEENKLMQAEFYRLEDLEDETDELKLLLKKEKKTVEKLRNQNAELRDELDEKNCRIENLKGLGDDLTSAYINGTYDERSKWRVKITGRILDIKEAGGTFDALIILQELLEEE